jgi:hypothetical protein
VEREVKPKEKEKKFSMITVKECNSTAVNHSFLSLSIVLFLSLSPACLLSSSTMACVRVKNCLHSKRSYFSWRCVVALVKTINCVILHPPESAFYCLSPIFNVQKYPLGEKWQSETSKINGFILWGMRMKWGHEPMSETPPLYQLIISSLLKYSLNVIAIYLTKKYFSVHKFTIRRLFFGFALLSSLFPSGRIKWARTGAHLTRSLSLSLSWTE